MHIGMVRGGGPWVDEIFHDVFPTYVGVFRLVGWIRAKLDETPHLRGDDPTPLVPEAVRSFSTVSPLTWGCSAGVLPVAVRADRFPHVSGGDPIARRSTNRSSAVSPRKWGWSFDRKWRGFPM